MSKNNKDTVIGMIPAGSWVKWDAEKKAYIITNPEPRSTAQATDPHDKTWDDAYNFLPRPTEIDQMKAALESLTSCVESLAGDQRDIIKLVGEIIDDMANSRENIQSIASLNETLDVMNSNTGEVVDMIEDITGWISNTNDRLNNLEAQPMGLDPSDLGSPIAEPMGPSLGSEGADTHLGRIAGGLGPRDNTSNKPKPVTSWLPSHLDMPELEAPRPNRYAKHLGLCRLVLDIGGALGIGWLITYIFRLIHG